MKHIPDWLQDTGNGEAPFSTETVLERLALSLVAGFVVAGVYVVGMGRRRDENASLTTTLVLLTVVIAIVTLVIGNSVARAFGLVGALSIVRFRTVVEDTRDTAFVIFAVVVGMAIGAGFPTLALLGVPVVLAAVLIMRLVHRRPAPPGADGAGTLTVRVGLGNDPEPLVAAVFAQHLAESHLIGTGTAKQGALLEATYRVRLKSPGKAVALVSDLNRVEGIQAVELKQD